MKPDQAFTYDHTPYTSHTHPQTHPDRLAALATLFGMQPQAVENCKILELGCGDGMNIIPMAYGLPQSDVLGIDLSGNAIDRGRKMIKQLQLQNISLQPADIMAFDENLGPFDYIIAHGVFSWVPFDVREKILQICQQNLSPQGVAFISYNAYPGGHMLNMVNDVMRFHTNNTDQPDQKIIQARAILKFIADSVPATADVYGNIFKNNLKTLSEDTPDNNYNCLYHDRLAEINQPFYFHEFMSRARGYNLKYLAEADFKEMQDHLFNPEIRTMLEHLGGGDIIVKEQYLDFLKGRRFRQTLLCHDSVSLERSLQPETMTALYYSCPSKPVGANGQALMLNFEQLLKVENLKFRRPNGYTMTTKHPIPRIALSRLASVWPQRLSLDELLRVTCKYHPEAATDIAPALTEILLSCFSVNVVEAHAYTPSFASAPGDYPTASPLARLQAQTQSRVTNLCHKIFELEGTYGQLLLPLLDGQRHRREIIQEMQTLVRAKGVVLNGKAPAEKSDSELIAEIETEMAYCARHAFLVA